MTAAFVLAILCYSLFMVFLMTGWRRIEQQDRSTGKNKVEDMISVLIPVRNERDTIISLLHDLKKQKDQFFEVIVIDDQSNDNTYEVANQVINDGFENARIIKVDDGAGKKRALEQGVKNARGSIIVTTDADCHVDRFWLSTFRRWFDDPRVKFVFGGVRIKQRDTLWSSIQAIELASLIGSGASSLAWGFPTMCNGANLAYRKTVFEEVGGFAGNQHIASGDDVFMLQKVHARFPNAIRFNSDPESVVETNPISLSSFVKQRIRWAGKWKSFRGITGMTLPVFIFLFYISLLAMLVWSVMSQSFVVFLGGILVKATLELFFLKSVMRYLGSQWNWLAFILLSVVYPLYAVFFGIAANVKSPEWKGRKIRSIKINPGLSQNH